MDKQYIPLFLDFNEMTQDLTDEECGRLVRSIVDYANGIECESRLCGAEKIAFRFLKGIIDRNKAISEVRAKAGANKNKSKQTETNENKTEQTETKNTTKKEKEKEKENKKEGVKGFTPPTLDEVRQYCQERRNGINPQYFIDYYAARGWELSNGKKVKDWRACIRTWENRDRQQGKKVIAQDFSQRDYSDVPAQMMDDLAAEMAEFKKGAG